MSDVCYLGVDAGSVTAKCVLLSREGRVLRAEYRRHGADVRRTLADVLGGFSEFFPEVPVVGMMTGSASLGLPDALGLPFEQEVLACERAVRRFAPDTDVAVELGGEDAKILYLSHGTELRMNEACAGGTGAFIDQMAALLHTDASGMDGLAAKAGRVFPIASRCGVFAKTDVVSLLNEGASREDLAASVFQAVVEQTVSGLACGRPVRGRVAFLGGPLHFLPELRRRFVETLRLSGTVSFAHGQFMVAIGAALGALGRAGRRAEVPVGLRLLADRLRAHREAPAVSGDVLPPLFADEAEYRRFVADHAGDGLPQADLSKAEGDLFLGVDCGSTTVKTVLVDGDGAVLDHSYGRNEGRPLARLLPYVAGMLDRIPPAARLRGVVGTGYGGEFAVAALSGAFTEVETVAHLKAARVLEPGIDSLIDIGGQDMKYLRIEDGALTDVRLNEACSSGCGAFLETFAGSLGLTMDDFVRAALFARHPVDLGSRCTVFMNSKVKQAQKEGAAVADIAAGLCYSVARNALYKVLRLRSPDELGRRVMAQGGSFLNDALLRVFERLLSRSVRRPDLAGHMGAYGAALLARERAGTYAPAVLTPEAVRGADAAVSSARCARCGNRCRLTVSRFPNGRTLVSGNRCERGAGGDGAALAAPNLYAWKLRHLFDRAPLAEEDAPRGVIGVPRVLNMYELYPFWFTLFTNLGFRVVLSPPSDKALYALGFDSMPSQTVCLPAKLVHGHVAWLVRHGVRHVFLPCLPRERLPYAGAPGAFNCPVVAGYPEVVRLNADEIAEAGAVLHAPFLDLDHGNALVDTIATEFRLPALPVAKAVEAARKALEGYRAELRAEAGRIVGECEASGRVCIVMAGRPYHADPLVNHGLPELAASLGAAVVTEDGVAHLAPPVPGTLRVVDQWPFHSRLYAAARFVAGRKGLELVQMTSFGCGLDAITADQVAEILRGAGRLHTLIKIDEGPALGAARIRLRSLLAVAGTRPVGGIPRPVPGRAADPVFTREMRDTHDILIPQMAPIHLGIIEGVLAGAGYRVRLLPKADRRDVETGLRYVHNDACFPAQVVIGQLVRALGESEDPGRCAVLLTQTCGPCRATNYPALLKRAMDEAGFVRTPLLTVAGGRMLTNHPGFSVTGATMRRVLRACMYGDLLQRLYYICRTHETTPGVAEGLLSKWVARLRDGFSCGGEGRFSDNVRAVVEDFAAVGLDGVERPKVGIVGEILMTYHPDANRHVADVVIEEGGEPILPELTDFLLYCASDVLYSYRSTGGNALSAYLGYTLTRRLDRRREEVRAVLREHGFPAPGRFFDMADGVGGIVSNGHLAGEGWLLAAEMVRLMADGVDNALCLQPFGCLPNHITGRGVFKELKRLHPDANLMAVDYEPGSSEANQLNRIKLFMSLARERRGGRTGPSSAFTNMGD